MSFIAIETPQNVKVNFKLAPMSDRLFASFIDVLFCLAYISVMTYIIVETELDDYFQKYSEGWLLLFLICVFWPVFFYSLLWEFTTNGRTPGKYLLKTKVIAQDAQPTTFLHFASRWFCRIFDLLGFGLFAMLFTTYQQRLGDLAADTVVISLKKDVRKVELDSYVIEDSNYVPTYKAVTLLSNEDYRIVKNTYETAMHYRDNETLKKLAKQIASTIHIQMAENFDYQEFIKVVLSDYVYLTKNDRSF